jgi:c-di-GMP-related signal transduction protein
VQSGFSSLSFLPKTDIGDYATGRAALCIAQKGLTAMTATASTAPTGAPQIDNNVFVGRQAILDRERESFAYELLFRANTSENFFNHNDGDRASGRTINAAMNVLGLHAVTGGHKAFINITRKLLVNDLYTVLPVDEVVIELLENIEPDQEVIKACEKLKERGYLLALDDFEYKPEYEPLMDMADFVKIQFMGATVDQLEKVTERFAGKRTCLLAEKVETQEDFEQGLKLGYSYFQGYFFCKPEILAGREIPAFKRSYIRFLQQLNQPEIDFAELESIIKEEVSLSVKLLRYLNSAKFGMRSKIDSIKQALALLGERPLKQWASLVALSSLADDKPTELVTLCLIRARFCEQLCPLVGMKGRELDLFLMGLLSAIDALVDRPLNQILSEMPLAHDVRAALMGSSTLLGSVYGLLLACERGNTKVAQLLAGKLKLDEVAATNIYCQSMLWADQILHF